MNGFPLTPGNPGDITGVTAGTGLSGGGTSGSVTLAIDTSVTVDKTTAQALSNKTLTAPVIADFTSAAHDHSNAAGGGSLGSNVVGATQLAATALRIVTFMGHNNTGACTATGLKVGDAVVSLLDATSPPFVDARTNFQAIVTVADQIQQTSASDLSTHFFLLLVVAKGG